MTPEERQAAIDELHATLSDPEKRAAYKAASMAQVRREMPRMTDEQLEHSWIFAMQQFGYGS